MQNDTQSNEINVQKSVAGFMVGQSATHKVGFYGTTPVVQRSGAAQVAVVTTGTTSTAPFGFSSAAQGDAMITLVNEMRAALVALGIITGAA